MSEDLGDAARRGLERAGVHLKRAAMEVVEGISAFLEEIGRDQGSRDEHDGRQDDQGERDESPDVPEAE